MVGLLVDCHNAVTRVPMSEADDGYLNLSVSIVAEPEQVEPNLVVGTGFLVC